MSGEVWEFETQEEAPSTVQIYVDGELVKEVDSNRTVKEVLQEVAEEHGISRAIISDDKGRTITTADADKTLSELEINKIFVSKKGEGG